ncbi:MAG: DUF805 domain-containing protein [Rubrivivax sp.]|jgi:uncharacterized membrane protein YhaH (DUF805 family)|nr:DUF805 domain-containing protein [Rubrivivax sp.]
MPNPTAADSPNDDLEPMPPWRVFLGLRGRIPRRTFWIYGIGALFGLAVLLQALLGIARVGHAEAEALVNVLLLWPAIAVSVKRWHDRDRSGWWVLVVLIPVIGWLWVLIDNGFLRGTAGPNRFGPDPLASSARA